MLQRSINTLPRETLDWPLALLSMDWRVDLFLSGPVPAQLPKRQTSAAIAANALPAAHHAHWSRMFHAATELGAEMFISVADAQRWGLSTAVLALPVALLSPAEIHARQAQCRHLLNV